MYNHVQLLPFLFKSVCLIRFIIVQSLSRVRGLPGSKTIPTDTMGYQPSLQEEAKSKGEKERYSHLNAEFQRIARRGKKAFLSDQCKEIEENNRMGKTRDLFKKIKRYQGSISCKNGLNKGQKWYGPNRGRRY